MAVTDEVSRCAFVTRCALVVGWFMAFACGHAPPVDVASPAPPVETAVSPVPAEPRPAESAMDAEFEPYDLFAAALERLHEAGDTGRCRAEMGQLRREFARDVRLTDADLAAERRGRDTRGTGPMPYPSAGTACAIFGIQTVLEGAVNDRALDRGEPPPYAEDRRPLAVGGE